jgi:asparagine synthase (glutamine-hydrolysing)
MCGIAGLIDSTAAAPLREAAVGRMCNAMRHRGPDDDGIESSDHATLGARRLAIFDPAHGRQPMAGGVDGRFRIVFNGAIYNFRALRDELRSAGFAFRTECDTEVLLAAYVRWGERCLVRLRGMFAFAIWDRHEHTLFLARDPFGIKPLYYRQDGARLLFASEVTALTAAGSFAPEIDPRSVSDCLAWLAVPAPRTIYRNVFCLRPGESATFRDGRLDVRPAWRFSSIPDDPNPCATREAFTRELRARLEDSVRAHVAADVPVGALLSGGLDSCAIVGLMAATGGPRLRTFSIGFEEAGYNEAREAGAAARHFGAEHHPHILTASAVARDRPALMAAYDQPTGDGLNTHYASQAARAGGVTVALSGLGGDELFGGYPSFRDGPRFARWLPRWHRLPGGARRALLARLRRSDARARKLADLLEHAHNLPEFCALYRRASSLAQSRDLLHPDAHVCLQGQPPHHPECEALSVDLAGAGGFEMLSAWELRTYTADVLLRDSDTMSLRHSLELRVPFIDRPLIEWLWRQPARFKDDRRNPKSALAAAVGDLLPPGAGSRKKRGFTLPFAAWMRAELRPFLDETFSDASVTRSGLFAREPAQQLWRRHLAGGDPRSWSRVWNLAVLIEFANRRPAATGFCSAAPAPAAAAVLSAPSP